MRRIKLSIVIPVFNEESNLLELHTRLAMVLNGMDYEVIFIDDGSRDKTFQFLNNIAGSDKRVKIIQFTRNFGQHQAIMAGFGQAKGDIVVTLDADLQNPPEEIPKLLAKIDEGYEIVFGIPSKKEHSLYRRVGSSVAKWILSKMLKGTTDFSGFRAIKINVIKQLLSLKEKHKFIDGLMCWMGYRAISIEVRHDKRLSGQSKYNLLKLIEMWIDMVVSLTDIPLRIAIFGGLFLGIVGFILVVGYIILYFVSAYVVPGFITTTILISFFAGVQLFFLGIVGEYIGRINNETKNKPDYIVREYDNRYV